MVKFQLILNSILYLGFRFSLEYTLIKLSRGGKLFFSALHYYIYRNQTLYRLLQYSHYLYSTSLKWMHSVTELIIIIKICEHSIGNSRNTFFFVRRTKKCTLSTDSWALYTMSSYCITMSGKCNQIKNQIQLCPNIMSIVQNARKLQFLNYSL